MGGTDPGPTAGGPVDRQAIVAICRRVLEANWREGTRNGTHYAYTAPSPGRYPWQWYWDSCFTAIARRSLDPSGARRELESLLRAARPDGFIGHTIFWGAPVDRVRSLFYNVNARRDFMTSTIQPPLLPWAWSLVAGDPAQVPEIVRHHDWVERERAIDEDGLIWLIQPDESGLDASPKFDSAFGWEADGLPGFPLLVRRNRGFGFDIRRIASAGGPLVCGTMTNVLNGLSRIALGRPSITPRLLERHYDERTGLFHQIVRRGSREMTAAKRVVTWAALSPLALPDLPEDVGRRLVEEHLLNPRRFWLPFPPPSVSAEDELFSRGDRFLGLLRRYWRGPTWINAAWLLWLGLVRLGYEDAAAEMGRRLATAVAGEGLREYYDPYTGDGMGARDFSWSALILEMIGSGSPPIQ